MKSEKPTKRPNKRLQHDRPLGAKIAAILSSVFPFYQVVLSGRRLKRRALDGRAVAEQ